MVKYVQTIITKTTNTNVRWKWIICCTIL